jgi:hypothetical protein
MKEKLRWICPILGAAGLFVLCIQFFTISVLKKKSSQIDYERKKSELYQASLFYNFRHSYDYLDSALIIRDLNAQIISIANICKYSRRLVLYYPEEICSSCFDTHFKNILKILDSGLARVSDYCIFTRFDNYRVMKFFHDENKLTCEIYNVEMNDNTFSTLPNFPVLLTIDGSGRINNFFLIQDSSLDLIKDYLKIFSN